MFKNETQQVGIEPLFTNALIRRFARSQVATVLDKDTSPVVLEGTIKQINTEPGPALTNATGQLESLPDGAVLVTNYRLIITTSLRLKRKSDDKIVWEGSFQNEKVYSAPRIGTATVNSADATYNHSAKMQKISEMADEMMIEAHDRITENF